MATSCVTVPTLTTFGVSTSQSFVTTSTQSVSTGPNSVSTTVFRVCSPEPCRVITSFITIPGNTTTVTVPATLTVDVPVTVSTTLFGSSCTTSSTSPSNSPTSIPPTTASTSTLPTSSTSDSTSTSGSTTTSSTSSIVLITPPPTIITSSSLVTSDGSTFTSFFLSTSTSPVITSSVGDPQSTGTSSNRGVAAGPIVGGVIGGLAALLLLGLLTWRLVKKQSKFDVFGNNGGHHNHNRSSPHQDDPLLEKPYQYGMVGLPTSNPVSLSLPDQSAVVQNVYGNNGGIGQGQAQGPQSMTQSTTAQTAVSNDGGLSQGVTQGPFGNDGGLTQGAPTTSGHGIFGNDGGLGQAAGPSGTVGTDGGLGQTASGGGHGAISNLLPPITHNDPSIIPLIAGLGTAAAASGVYAATTSSRPSSSRPSTSSSSQPLITPTNTQTQGNYPSALQNWNATGYGQAYAGPSTSSNSNTQDNGAGPSHSGPSHSSPNSSLSAYSHTSWVGNSSTNYRVGEGSGSGSGAPGVLPSMGAAPRGSHQQHHQRPSFGRVSTLQVTNGPDDEYQPYGEIGSLSFTMGATGSSSSSDQAPSYDGKGRPVNMLPEKAPLVHLDGALYQQPPRGGPRSGTAPPEYIE